MDGSPPGKKKEGSVGAEREKVQFWKPAGSCSPVLKLAG